jgi:hypothetical protein
MFFRTPKPKHKMNQATLTSAAQQDARTNSGRRGPAKSQPRDSKFVGIAELLVP